MDTIYVVFGSTGEYSDRQKWLVKAFHHEDDAKQLVEDATKSADSIYAKYGREHYGPYNGKNTFDPDMRMEYTGTRYYYKSVGLE